jgi:hypothetical protein
LTIAARDTQIASIDGHGVLADADLMTRTLTLGLILFATAVAGVAAAHSTGHESRTPAQCERLPGTQAGGERAQCLRCVTRPRKHHYHPDYPPGERCRPDNGRP